MKFLSSDDVQAASCGWQPVMGFVAVGLMAVIYLGQQACGHVPQSKKDTGGDLGQSGVAPLQVSLLATIPDDLELTTPEDFYIDFAPDGQNVAYVARKGAKKVVVVGSTPGKPYDDIFWLGFAPDGRRIAYLAQHRIDEEHEVTLDVLVVGSEEWAFFFGMNSPEFSPDGSRLAYQAHAGSGSSSTVIIQADGEFPGYSDTWFDDVEGPLFAPDGRVAYAWMDTHLELLENGNFSYTENWFLTISPAKQQDTQEERGYPLLGSSVRDLVFSPDWKRFAYAATGLAMDKWSVMVGKRQEKEYDWVSRITFHPNGQNVAYAAVRGAPEGQSRSSDYPPSGGKWFMVHSGAEGEEFDYVGSPVFSPTGKRLAYSAAIGCTVRNHRVEGGKWFVVCDGQKLGPFKRVGNLRFDPTGDHLAFRAKDDQDKWFVVTDGTPGPTFDYIAPWIVFGPNGKVIAYRTRSGEEMFLVIGKRKYGPYNWVDRVPRFSADGKRVSFGVRSDRQLLWQVAEVRK